jgi:hypothetical protein
MGYPINFMYGEAASGKSNLLQTIAYAFGFDTRFLSSGNDTAMNLLHNMEYYSSVPVLYAEIEGYMRKNFETTVKAVYDRNARKRMTGFGQKQDIRAVNGTLNFASNDRAHRNPQTATRLVYTEFYQDNFNPKEASKINNIRETGGLPMDCFEPKKLALLRIWQILHKYSDQKRTLTQDDIANYLDRDYGIILPDNNEDGVREAILSVLDEKDYREKATALCYDRIVNNYTWKHTADAFLRLIEQ